MTIVRADGVWTGSRWWRVALALSCAVISACASVTESVRVAPFSVLTLPNAGPDPVLIEKHCPFGQPQKLPALEHGPTLVITREAYALEHDNVSKIALWVCASLDPDLIFGDAERKDNWRPDSELDGKPRAVDADYRNSGFQRGHMTASEDRVATQDLNDSTFFLSNAVPQNGSLNGGQWAQLEATIRGWVKSGLVSDARMITGGFFYDPAEENAATADGAITYQLIGDGKVAVPTHVFKLVVGRRGTQQSAIAFVAENKRPASQWRFTNGIVSIDWLEERAGLNFMPDLDPADETTLESQVPAMWQP
jgi:DNA/RNA endonuclease G (NUC1)